jgi:hypothetical protein
VAYESVEGGKMSVYEIRVKGHLDGRWSEWFGGLTITNLENGATVLSEEIVDQAALHRVLNKVRNLNLPLISVTSIDPDQQQPAIDQRSPDQTPPRKHYIKE